MASKARKERRRLERERRHEAFVKLCAEAQVDEQTTAEMQSGDFEGYPVETPELIEVKRETISKIEADQQLSVETGVAQTQGGGEDEGEQAGKEAYSGGTLVEVVPQVEVTRHEPLRSYEEANWAKLSPMFREAHNKLRLIRGLPPIPPPAVDLYKPPLVKRVDPAEMDWLAREAKAAGIQFMGQRRMMMPGDEGYSRDGAPEKE